MAEHADGDGGCPQVPKGATYDLTKVLADRRRIRLAVTAEFPANFACVGTEFTRLVDVVEACLPPRVKRLALHESLRYLVGEPLTPERIDLMAWRMAGNVYRLARHNVVPPWSYQRFDEWVPVQITAARRRRGGRRREMGYLLTFQILAGSPCPLAMQRFWSDRVCRFMSTHMGFSRQRFSDRSDAIPRLVFHHPTELVTLRMYALVESRLCGAAGPGFEHTKVPPSCIEWNHEQMHHRDRLPVLTNRDTGAVREYTCPRGYPHELPCHRCQVGYVQCRAGTHRLTYEPRPCKLCNRAAAPFDPDLSQEFCVDCTNRRAAARDQ